MDSSVKPCAWSAVPGYEGFYEVSDTGRVRSLDRTIFSANQWGDFSRFFPGKLLRQFTRDGYSAVTLHRQGHTHSVRVANLVALAFLGPCPEGLELCHADGVRTNSDLTNLRYDTRSENAYDAVRHGTHRNTAKDSCPAGHEYNAVNTRITRSGWRICRACHREDERRRRRSHKLPV